LVILSNMNQLITHVGW